MLDKSQAVVVQTTVHNAAHLAVAISSLVFGNTVSGRICGDDINRSIISKLVVAEIRNKFMIKGAASA